GIAPAGHEQQRATRLGAGFGPVEPADRVAIRRDPVMFARPGGDRTAIERRLQPHDYPAIGRFANMVTAPGPWLLFGKSCALARDPRGHGVSMLDDPFKYGLLAALAIALLVAAATDLRSRRIGNWLTGAIAAAAPLFWWAEGLALWPDVAWQIGMALATFAVLAGLLALKAMGGGDVKLLTALALWIRPEAF